MNSTCTSYYTPLYICTFYFINTCIVYEQDRREWKHICKQCLTDDSAGTQRGILAPANTGLSYPCSCGRVFHRQGDLTRHSRFCDGSQHQSHRQSVSIFNCRCGRTFRWPGDLTRHSQFVHQARPKIPDLCSLYPGQCVPGYHYHHSDGRLKALRHVHVHTLLDSDC